MCDGINAALPGQGGNSFYWSDGHWLLIYLHEATLARRCTSIPSMPAAGPLEQPREIAIWRPLRAD